MRKLLIAQHSETTINSLTKALEKEWDIHATMDSYPVVDMLQYIKPEGMVIDLTLTPKNGLDVLDKAKQFLPPAVIATTDIINEYIQGEAERLGVGCLVRIPFRTEYIKECLEKLCSDYPEEPRDIVWLLHALSFSPKLTGYRCLITAVTVFANNPPLLLKEIYPTVAKLCGLNDARCVERVIRTAIHDAWRRRDISVWKKYFPEDTCPSNKLFISLSQRHCRLHQLKNH